MVRRPSLTDFEKRHTMILQCDLMAVKKILLHAGLSKDTSQNFITKQHLRGI